MSQGKNKPLSEATYKRVAEAFGRYNGFTVAQVGDMLAYGFTPREAFVLMNGHPFVGKVEFRKLLTKEELLSAMGFGPKVGGR